MRRKSSATGVRAASAMGDIRKKICLASPEFPPEQWGGLARSVRNVARHARALGMDVHVAHFTVARDVLVLLDENRETQEVDGITVHRIALGREKLPGAARELWDCPHTLTLQMMYQSLEKLHSDVGFDLFHSFFLYPVGFVVGMLARRVGVPSIATIVGNDVKRYIFSPEKVAVCRSGLENADVVVGLSKDLIEMAHALTPVEHKARIIYNSVRLPESAWSARQVSAPFKIGCAGIFKYAKGLPYLLKAVSVVTKRHGVVVELVGTVRESEREAYEIMLERSGTAAVVRLREPLPHHGVTEWLRTLDLFVLPSVTEGCPNILMEAMAIGAPCVATRTGAVEFLIEDGVSGILARWGDSRSLADAIMKMITDRQMAESMGRRARERMTAFSPEVEKNAWEQVYRDLLQT